MEWKNYIKKTIRRVCKFFPILISYNAKVLFYVFLTQEHSIAISREILREDRKEVKKLKLDLDLQTEELAVERKKIAAERLKLAGERKSFNQSKYTFLLENAIVPEWREEDVKKLLMYDFLVEANLNFNALLNSKQIKENSI